MLSERQSEQLWERLLQFIDEGRVIPIVGRDLLTVQVAGRDVDLYEYLAGQLADKLGVSIDDVAGANPLNAVACRYLEADGDIEDVYAGLKTVMPDPGDVTLPDALVKLARINPLKLFVTTTFDPLLEAALNRERFGGKDKTQVLAYSPDDRPDLPAEMKDLDRPLVYHLFGRVSAVPDYAVTEEDTLEFMHSLQSETGRPGLLFDELTRQQLLIIGCSFPDWLTRFLIRITKGKRLWEAARGKTEVVVDKAIGNEPGLAYFLEHFSARTKILPESPTQFVNELYDRWAAAHRRSLEVPAVPEAEDAPVDMEPGAIFISYASEDLGVVEAIKRDLERLGLDVWFDKDALRGGDAYESKIKRNIENCSCFVPIVSRQTLTPERRFFRIEWAHAQEVAKMVPSGQRFIVPVAIDETGYGEKALPEAFRAVHWMRLTEGRATEEFCTTLREIFRGYQKQLAGAAR